ncbi:50S ribosomal protein L33 [Candidatus Aerophobetes bacterium]|nr:50S ribosomal protein L33 [Candidatus Aerophobetes bacterium]
MKQTITLICTECKRRNYTTTREKKVSSLSLKKYCRFCRKHILHKEK